MKKILIILYLTCMANIYLGQDFETGFPKPVASVSSLSAYTNSPVSFATGVPDISFPLLSLPTNSQDITAGISISYHPKNLLGSEKASEVGLGWSLLGMNGVISREIVKGLDERYRDSSSPGYIKNEFDDIYYYNIGGYSGKFRIIRDMANNTFQLVKLTPSNVKIDYVRDGNTSTLIFNSFKITDEKGNIYLFDKNSISEYKESSWGIDYKSAFYLTKIYNYKMQELVSMDYQIDTYTSLSAPTRTFQTCKLKKIESKDNGSIELDYTYSASYRNSMNDPYQVNSLVLKNNAGTVISKLEFTYNYSSFTNPLDYNNSISKRVLHKIKRYSADLVKNEVTEFEYNISGSIKEYSPVPDQFKDYFLCDNGYKNNEIESPKYFPLGSLKKIKLPTGGAVEYNFEANEYAVDNFGAGYITNLGLTGFVDPQIQYVRPLSSMNFDTNISKTYHFTVSGDMATSRAVYVKFIVDEIKPYHPMLDPGDGSSPTLNYSIPGAAYIEGVTGILCATESPQISTARFILPGGAHTLQIETLTGGKGYMEIYEMAIKDGPYRNAMIDRDQGIRIADIKYFDTYFSQNPVKTERFEYDKFDDSNVSSGEQVAEGSVMGYMAGAVVYKNIKVINGDNGGYTKYYYKSPLSYPLQSTGSPGYQYWPNVNITKTGLIEKKEVYDTDNHLLASENYDYTIAEMDMPKYMPVANGHYETRTAWIKEQRVTSKVFDHNNRSVTTGSESIRSADDFNLITEKITDSDGSIQEKSYTYPREKNHTSLISANILGVPLETRISNNGIVTGKSEIKYDNPVQLYPTSVIGYTPDNLANSYTGIRYDVYDDKGHVVQYTVAPDGTAGAGNPVTVIWGYNKTTPIAKIDGAKLSDIPQYLIDSIVNASDEDAGAVAGNAQAKEDALLAQLENFKNHNALSGFTVTAYTYNPLVGVTNVLPPNGIREKYVYDSFGRLQKVIDVNGKLLKEYQYNYKQ